ncbi:MAG: hypothetical protein A4E29_00676 [Methanomassiliicoccales archaeon PtaB.Bin134]|nr:MAG: hypothetical protein A4E29_00676 [Methanomassiliicoccales archaeon PtaB.Bin134]
MSTGTKVRLGISIALIILVVLASNPKEVWEAFEDLNLSLIAIVVLLYLVNLVFKAYRWGVLMRHAGHDVSFRTIFAAFSLSQAINNLIPGRVVGETSRIIELKTKEGVAVGKGLAAVVTERIMDFAVLTILTVTSLFLLIAYIVDDFRGYLEFLVLLMVVANILFIYVLAKPSLTNRVGRFGARVIARVFKGEKGAEYSEKVMGTVHSFNEALEFRGNWKLLIWPSVLTAVIWANEIFRLQLIIQALGADVSLVAVIATASLASLSQVVLTAGSGNVLMSTAVFQACGLNPHLAATAGLLSAITSIWLSVPVALAAMFADRRLHPSKVKGAEGAKKE